MASSEERLKKLFLISGPATARIMKSGDIDEEILCGLPIRDVGENK
jgi:hypothetical protein